MSYLFITYTQVDQVYAQKLSEYLVKQGFNVWMYAQPGGSDALKDVIDKGIRESGAFLPLLTPAAQVAPHVMRELGMANQYGRPIFPVLLSGSTWRLLGTTEVEDVRQGNLPSTAFLDKLAQHVSRNIGQAKNMTSAEAQQSTAAPAPQDSPEMTSLSRPAGLRQLAEVYRATLQTPEEETKDTTPSKKQIEKPAATAAAPTPAAAEDAPSDSDEPGLTAISRPQGFDKLAELYRASLHPGREDKDSSANGAAKDK